MPRMRVPHPVRAQLLFDQLLCRRRVDRATRTTHRCHCAAECELKTGLIQPLIGPTLTRLGVVSRSTIRKPLDAKPYCLVVRRTWSEFEPREHAGAQRQQANENPTSEGCD